MEMNTYQTAAEVMQGAQAKVEAEAPEAPAEPAKEKTPRKTKKDRLAEVKDELKNLKDEIKTLKANKSKTEDEKRNLESLVIKSENLKIEQAELKKDIEAEKYNAVIRQKKKKLADKKQEAIIKVLEAEGINTENEVKGLIKIRRKLSKAGISGYEQLDKCLAYIKSNAPDLLQ